MFDLRHSHLSLLALALLIAAGVITIFSHDSEIPTDKALTAPRNSDHGSRTRLESKAKQSVHGDESQKIAALNQPTVEHQLKNVPLITDSNRNSLGSDSSPVSKRSVFATPRNGRSKQNLIPQASDSKPSAIAIQLGSNVQLPAAIMAKGDPSKNLATDAANDQIINDFYRELAERVAELETPISETESQHENTEPTQIISEGQIVREARDHANLRFRTLYGDEAYNRQLMNSNIELDIGK